MNSEQQENIDTGETSMRLDESNSYLLSNGVRVTYPVNGLVLGKFSEASIPTKVSADKLEAALEEGKQRMDNLLANEKMPTGEELHKILSDANLLPQQKP